MDRKRKLNCPWRYSTQSIFSILFVWTEIVFCCLMAWIQSENFLLSTYFNLCQLKIKLKSDLSGETRAICYRTFCCTFWGDIFISKWGLKWTKLYWIVQLMSFNVVYLLFYVFYTVLISKYIMYHKMQQKKIKLSMEVPYDDNFSDRY